MPRGLYKRKGNPTWYVLLYHQGERIRESTGTTVKKDAERYLDDLKTRLRTQARQNGPSWLEACTAWLKATERSANDKYILRALVAEVADRPLNECSAETFTTALDGLTNATYNRYRALIVAVCNLSGHKLKLPLKRVKKGRLRFLTRAEWDALYLALPAHLKPLAKFAISTGLRQKNVTQLRWDQVDMDGGKLWLHPDETKAGNAIGIPLSKDAQAVLTGQIGLSDEWVFPYKGKGRKKADRPMTKIKTAWQFAMQRAGLGHFDVKTDPDGKVIAKKWVGDFTWHGLRHTWASWHLMAGTPIETLAKLGGWEDLRMVQRYAHLAPEHLAGFADNAVPWERKSSETATKTATAA